MEEKTDTALVMAARKGDKEAFGALVQRYQASARRYALRLTGDNEWASELVQEAILQAYLSLEHLRDPGRFRSWLCGIVRNIHHDHLRESHNSVFLDEVRINIQPDTETSDNPSGVAEQTEQQTMLLKAIDRLSPEYGDVLKSFYFRGMTISEIALKTGDPEGAVKVRLHRARLKLKAILKSDYPEIVPVKGGKLMIPVTIADVKKKDLKDAEGRPYIMHVVILLDEAGHRILPIWVGLSEGHGIATGLSDFSTPRPLTFNFFAALLKAVDTQVEEVRVETLKENTFYGVVKVKRGRVVKEVDARPSDALALAVRTGSPIFVAEDVMERAGITLKTRMLRTRIGVDAINKEIGKTYRIMSRTPAKEEVDRVVQDLISDLFKS